MASGTSSTQEQQEEDASELQFPKGSLYQYIKLKLNIFFIWFDVSDYKGCVYNWLYFALSDKRNSDRLHN